MKRRIFSILTAICVACALFVAPALADDEQPEGAPAGESAAQAEGQEGGAQSEGLGEPEGAEAVPQEDPIVAVGKAVMPIVSIDKEALFARQFDWIAVENLNFESANEDGSLSEWQTDWFISHDWSDYGHVISILRPGDAVTVNGRTILILGRDMWSNEVYNWDVYDVIGWDKVVFQTCYGDNDIWISYGIPVYPTPDFLASHPPTN